MVRIKTTECALKDLQPGELFSIFPSTIMESTDAVGLACYIRTEKRSANGGEGIVHRVEVAVEGPKVQTLGDLWRLLPAMGFQDMKTSEEAMGRRMMPMVNTSVIVSKPNARRAAVIFLMDTVEGGPSALLYEGLDYQRMFDILQRLEGLLA